VDETPPPRPMEGPRLDAAEAERIAAVYDVRSFPLPPGDLLGDTVFDNDQRGTDLFDEAAKQAVAPHWNSAVYLLRGPDGYIALVRLRDRLAGHIAGIVREADQRSIRASIARSVGRILASEAERHGSDTAIGASLDGLPLSAHGNGWSWEPRRSWPQEEGAEEGGAEEEGAEEEGTVVPYSPPALFALRSAYLDALVAASESEHRDTFVEVQRDWTWARALSAASSAESRFSRKGFGTDVVDLAEFRLKVVEQVLREHELLGHVDEFGTGAHRRVELTSEQTAFLDAALAAIAEVEADAEDPSNKRRRSWSNVNGRMSDKTGWHLSTLERIAEKSFTLFGGPAFVKQEERGSGPLPRGEEAERYRRFCTVMEAYGQARSAPERSGSA
jgi:hypothetical protein